MAKKLADIRVEVESSADKFYEYLGKVLDKDTISIVYNISKLTNLYIFSGVIRNFFLNVHEIRDFDIVLEKEIDVKQFFKASKIKENSFGGYKIQIGKTRIDLWYLRNTWAIKQYGRPFDIPLEKYIPYTAFFNFSAIVFSFNEKKFYCHDAFLAFIRDKKINYLYEPNANTTLCIVNTLYYSDKYNLQIDNKLKRYVIRMFKSGERDYEVVQKKHFGKIIYPDKDILKRVYSFSNELKIDKIKKEKNRKKKLNTELPFPIWLIMNNN